MPPKLDPKLYEDKGTYYRDPNAARYPEYPIAPAVKAIVDTTNDAIVDADVFACGSTLGSLLRFARGVDKAFRFNIEVIGDTVFLIRKENDPKQLIEGVVGYGHSFPEAYTTWPKNMKKSLTHQRIVQYNLGGLQCLVRFECDGFFGDDSKTSSSNTPNTKQSPTTSSLDELAQALSDTTITPANNSSSSSSSKQPLTILHAGRSIPQASIFDLKTRSGRYKKDINMDDITPQLWIKQIPNFIVAYHDGYGLFKDIRIQDARPHVAAWEQDNAQGIQKFIVLLRKIIDVAKTDEKGLLEVYCPNNRVLEVRRQYGEGVRALPDSLREEWMARYERGGLALQSEDTEYGVSDGSESEEVSDDGFEDSDEERDFTACSAEECGYCGRCTY